MPYTTVNPHGYAGKCNIYCTTDAHALVILVESHNNDGSVVTEDSIFRGARPYYASLGWDILRAKPAEASREKIMAEYRALYPNGPCLIEAFSIEEQAVKRPIEDFEPWLLIVGTSQ